jgi:hypothetical protein
MRRYNTLIADSFLARDIADILGVDHQTVNNDLRGENSPPVFGNTAISEEFDDGGGEKSPPEADQAPDRGRAVEACEP